jgi:hypothetical protein
MMLRHVNGGFYVWPHVRGTNLLFYSGVKRGFAQGLRDKIVINVKNMS